ncbi:Carboxylate/amino_acid/amine transporter family protein [Hexamita inflata]|uniref:Carboxylate/amino_acid/amine transporter family protein n=1 Tax=Hexamita inflata TaxID=28002 RepID=A0ABP1HC80_9EUKA
MQNLLWGQSLCLVSFAQGMILQLCSEHYGTNLPFFTVAIGYLLLLSLLVFKPVRENVSKQTFWCLQLCGILDACANALSTLSHRYTSAGSVALLTSLDSIFSLLLSFIFLKQSFSIQQTCSIIFIILQTFTYILLDVNTQTRLTVQNPVLGDLIALLAALIYSVSSVLYQKFAQRVKAYQFAPVMSVGAFLLSFVLSCSIEIKLIIKLKVVEVVCLVVYGVGTMGFYIIAIKLIQKSNAVYYNVQLLLTNVYSFVGAVVIFKSAFDVNMFLVVAMIIAGVVVYQFA